MDVTTLKWIFGTSIDGCTCFQEGRQCLMVIKRSPGGYGRDAIKRSPLLVTAIFIGSLLYPVSDDGLQRLVVIKRIPGGNGGSPVKESHPGYDLFHWIIIEK